MVVSKTRLEYITVTILSALLSTQFCGLQIGAIAIALLILLITKDNSNVICRSQFLYLTVGMIIYTYYYMQYYYSGYKIFIVFGLGASVAYMAGRKIILHSSDECESMFIRIVKLIVTGCSIFALLCIIYKITHMSEYMAKAVSAKTYDVMIDRFVLDIWTGELFHPTNFNSLLIFAAVSIPCLFILETGIKNKIWQAVMISITLVACFFTASRSNIVFIVLAVATNVILRIWLNNGNRFIVQRKTILVLLGVSVIALLISLVFKNDIMNYLESTALFERSQNLTVKEDGRWTQMQKTLDVMFLYPFGNMPVEGYAHNLFLDIAREAGIIPMILIMLYCFSTLMTTIKVIRLRAYSYELRIMIAVMKICIFAAFMIEPVIQGRIYVFMLSCLIDGMIYSLRQVAYYSNSFVQYENRGGII